MGYGELALLMRMGGVWETKKASSNTLQLNFGYWRLKTNAVQNKARGGAGGVIAPGVERAHTKHLFRLKCPQPTLF